MNAFLPVDPAAATGKAAQLLTAVKAKLGIVPNMTRHMARSPAVLEAYLAMNGALAAGALDAKLREQIALATAQANACDYCLSAHSMIGKGAGLDAADIARAREGDAADGRAGAVLAFVKALLAARGQVTEADVAAVRAAGLGDGAIGEIVANVALNVFTNYFNNVTHPVIDFPVVRARAVAKAA
ncbi:MAG: carboxymuconolactone decarboxylase family protein [Burkholderiales bacterium]